MAAETARIPRVGIPYRTRKEELTRNRSKYDKYFQAVRQAGAEPVEISLSLAPELLRSVARTLDAIVLPGSPADVNPELYRADRNPLSADADLDREQTDFALLDHAFAEQKPVLAICYGTQSLNVFLGGSLIQDIPSEVETEIQHPWSNRDKGAPEPFHLVRIEEGSRLEAIADSGEARVNSSHHQAVLEPGRNLRVVAWAKDGVVEAVEWTGDQTWVTGVQWHPERMVETDALAQALFSSLVAATRKAPVKLR